MSTAAVSAAAPAAALVEWGGEWMLEGNLEEALGEALATLFQEGAGQLLTLSLSYRHRLATPQREAPDPLPVEVLPVALIRNQPLAPEIPRNVAAAATSWWEEEKPVGEGGEWLVSLTLSSPPPAPRPIFALDHLVVPLKGSA
jgi:hypothetical protein